MSKSVFKCYFGCAGGCVLHKFPSWEYPTQEKFLRWKAVVDTDTQKRGNKYIFYFLRLCERHFEQCFISQYSGRLTKNAVPTLNLVQLQNKENDTPSPNNAVHNSQNLQTTFISAQKTDEADEKKKIPDIMESEPSTLKITESKRKYIRGIKRPNTVVQTSLTNPISKTPTPEEVSLPLVSTCPNDLKEVKSERKYLRGLRKTNAVERNILPAECEETADFLLIFDKLFDSFNGHSYQGQSKVYKNCIKNDSPHFKLWADLLPILESIKFESVEKKNGIEVIKQVTIPSIKNWIHNIKSFNEMWNDLRLNYGIKNLITRNFNQDPLENFFSSIRSNGVRNVNPNCDQFTNAYKTLIVNNFNSPHSPGANCENDQDNCFQSLKNMITDINEVSQPDFACELDSLLNILSDIKNNESIVHAESKKYVTGYVIKKCKSKIFKACRVCKNDFCRSDIDSFNHEMDYTKKSFYPSDQIINLMNEMYFVITACMRQFPESKKLSSKISFYIDFACNFNPLTCKKHKTALINFMKILAMKIIINTWCNNVNRIINGKFLKFNKNDPIKNQANSYFFCKE